MSFGLNIKNELCASPVDSPCCAVAESFGILLFCSHFTPQQIRISTICQPFALRLPSLFQESFGLEFDQIQSPEADKTGKFLFVMKEPDKIQRIFQALDYAEDFLACHVNFALVEEDCCQKAFVRGAFLAGGSISDPEKSYHLEFSTSHSSVGNELAALLNEKHLQPKLSQRKGHNLCYFKQKSLIQKCLLTLGAEKSAQELEKISQLKHITSAVNRQVNCDAANLEKSVDAAQNQIQSIKILQENGAWGQLPAKLQETATLRVENPDCTLSQLAEYFSPPITKSALNHRLRKLMELAGGGTTKEE